LSAIAVALGKIQSIFSMLAFISTFRAILFFLQLAAAYNVGNSGRWKPIVTEVFV
jgi:hypothetical protein